MKYIAYDKNTMQALGYIENEYTTKESTTEVFKNLTNYEVAEATHIIPAFNLYKVVLENNKVVDFELIEKEA